MSKFNLLFVLINKILDYHVIGLFLLKYDIKQDDSLKF